MTPSNQILSRIVRIIVNDLGSNITVQDLQGVARLDEVIAFDSMAMLKFALGLEREFAISLKVESFDPKMLQDVGRLVAYLEQRVPTSSE